MQIHHLKFDYIQDVESKKRPWLAAQVEVGIEDMLRDNRNALIALRAEQFVGDLDKQNVVQDTFVAVTTIVVAAYYLN